MWYWTVKTFWHCITEWVKQLADSLVSKILTWDQGGMLQQFTHVYASDKLLTELQLLTYLTNIQNIPVWMHAVLLIAATL
jgi:hypothetical protein